MIGYNRWLTAARAALLVLILCLPLADCAVAPATHAAPSSTYAGMPPIDRIWTPADYDAMSKVFVPDGVPLPRYADPAGRALIEHITDPRNIASLNDPSVPLPIRIQGLFTIETSVAGLTQLYQKRWKESRTPYDEAVRYLAFSLDGAAMVHELISQYIPTVPKDAQYGDRIVRMQKMASDVSNMVSHTLSAAEDTDASFPAADRSLLFAALARDLPMLQRAFTDDFRSGLLAHIKADRERFRDPGDQASMDAMITSLERAKPLASDPVWSVILTVPDPKQPVTTVHHRQAGTLGADGWTAAASTEGGYSLKLPCLYDDYTKSFPDPAVPVDRSDIVVCTAGDKTIYTVMRIRYKTGAAAAQAYFEKLKQRLPSADAGKGSQDVSTGSYAGMPMIDNTVNSDKGCATIRAILTGADIMSVTVEATNSDCAKLPELDAKFFPTLTIVQH